MSLQIGQRVGSYEITTLLGKGGMGEVYLARDARLDRSVAIKTLPEQFESDAERLARFEREAKILASLNHPNIGAIYGLEKHDGRHILVLELLEGQTLADLVARGPMPMNESLRLAVQIAEALQAAHEKGVIHRDLKPANIKITRDGTVKVLDFGLAKAGEVESSDGDGLSNSPTLRTLASTPGMILGTAAYMSPEQAKGRPVDRRTDIFAFGCVLYEMLTGKPAFAGETAMEILSDVMKTDPDWSALPATTPSLVRSLLRRCLQKDPTQRLRDIADARFQIEEALAEQPTAVQPVMSHHRAVGWLKWAAVLMLAILLVVTATKYFDRDTNNAPEARLQINTGPGGPNQFAISPDGTRIVYVAPVDGQARLHVRPLRSETPQTLTQTQSGGSPFWSADGKSVGFVSGSKLEVVDIDSGAVRTIADTSQFRGGAWSGDGVILFAPGASGPLVRVSANGGDPVEVTKVIAPQTSHRFPSFLPDGRHFFFYVAGTPEVRGVYAGSLDSKETHRLVDSDTGGVYAPPDLVLFARQAKLFAQHLDVKKLLPVGEPFGVAEKMEMGTLSVAGQLPYSASLTGTLVYRGMGRGTARQLTWFTRTGAPVGTLGDIDRQSSGQLVLSQDGGYVAISREVDGNADVWLMETARGVLRRLTTDGVYEGYPVLSPDGTQLLFNSYLKGKTDLYLKSTADASAGTLLLETPVAKNPADWSPDGRFILYDDFNTLWALPLQGNKTPITIANRLRGSYSRFSPDGRWVSFGSIESGTVEIYVQPFPGPGPKTRISTKGGGFPVWRADSSELFYLAPDDRLMAVSLKLNDKKVEVGTPKALFPLRIRPPGTLGPHFAVSPDGQRFLVNTIVGEGETAPLTVILNWKAKP